MSRIRGRDPRLAAVDAAGIDRKRIAQIGASAVLKMTVCDGLFHADLHPGYFFILPSDRIAFIDLRVQGLCEREHPHNQTSARFVRSAPSRLPTSIW